MLTVLDETKKKKTAQEQLKRNLKSTLRRQGIRNIGFPGGNADVPIYSVGAEELWVAFGESGDASEHRYWNAFGAYQPDQPAQSITVEINILTHSNNRRVAGFFAEDSESGDIFLMHSGKVGGGRPGIGKTAFLAWSKTKLIDVSEKDGGFRTGIAVGKLHDPNLADRIWTFVRRVQDFKDQAAGGALETPEFKRRVEEFERYSQEFSGNVRGTRGGSFEYVTYHGDIVQQLYDERTAQLSQGEKVFNTRLIYLFAKKDNKLTEVYEVKTGIGRQEIYTAIGQVVTHAANGGRGEVAKFLVVPADENIPKDLECAIASLGIKIRRFRFQKAGRGRIIKLVRYS